MTDHRGAIENLLYTYAEAIDAGDYEAIGALFAHGAIADADGTPMVIGAQAVTAMYVEGTRKYEDGTPRSHHVTTNPLIEIADDEKTAICRSRFTVFQQTDEIPLQPIITGSYTDAFEQVDGKWRFVERRMRPPLYGDLSKHLLMDIVPPKD